MKIEIDGQGFDVPDDATPDEIDQITRPASAPAKASIGDRLLGGLKRTAAAPYGALEAAGSLASQAISYLPGAAAAAGAYYHRYLPGNHDSSTYEFWDKMTPPAGDPRSPYKTEEERSNALQRFTQRRAMDDAGRARQQVTGILPSAPQTEAGQEMLGGVASLFRPVQWVGDKAGDAAAWGNRQLGGSPEDQQVVKNVFSEAIPAMLTEGATRVRLPAPKTAATAPGSGIAAKLLREPKPIPEAQYLADRGVPLTRGQLDPASGYGQVELASTSKGGVGPLIRAQRQTALERAMDLAFKEAAPPGASVDMAPFGRDINAKYSALKGAWDEAYGAVRAKGETMYPAMHDGKGGVALASTETKPGLLAQIVDDPSTIWDDASRNTAKRFLENQVSRLPEAKGSVGRVAIDDVLKVSSEIKKAERAALRGQRYDLAEILGRSGDAVDNAIESQASPETAAALRQLRGGYRNFKIVEDAVIRTGDSPHGILPSRLSASVRSADALRSNYAAGGGGQLRDLSKAIARVFDESAAPPTGARLLAASPSWLSDTLIAPTLYLRNTGAAAGAGASLPVRPPLLPPHSVTAAALLAAALRRNQSTVDQENQ